MTEKSHHSVLLVSSGDKGIAAITRLLESNSFLPVATARTSGEARRILCSEHFDIVIINTPLSDDFGIELALHIAESSCSGILMIAKADISEAVAYKTEDMGVITVAKPIDATMFHHGLKILSAMQNKFAVLEQENKKLKLKLDELKIVQRAKNMLMENLDMTESEAHRFIEKQAMDMRTTKYEVANSVIKTYTNS